MFPNWEECRPWPVSLLPNAKFKIIYLGCQRREHQINYGMDTIGEKEKRTSKKNIDGRSTSSHDNKKLVTKSMEKQRGIVFGFRKTATAVKKQIDR